MSKRLFDIFSSLVGLILLLPWFLVIALLNKLSGNDVFFCKRSIGKNLRQIRVYKFTTMVRNAHQSGGTITYKNDPRITFIGNYLRKWKLDEFPQLINVLKGDMSLVGPRPLSVDKLSLYDPEIAYKIYSVRPGITGFGSLYFSNEQKLLPNDKQAAIEIYKKKIIPRKARLELWYVEHQNFCLDIKIILRTLKKLCAQ